ncbi:MAG: DUF3131 domain-containing protein [bacterium]
MSFKEGLINARSHIAFMLGLVISFSIVIRLEGLSMKNFTPAAIDIEHSADISSAEPAKLTFEERQWARIAWKYFENNYVPTTGLVNSVDGFQASTLWDTASYLMALISAYRLEIISDAVFDERMQLALQTLAKLPLHDNDLPNKSYNTVTTDMVNYGNEKTDRGIGWSSIDIGRLLVPINVIVWNYPQYTQLAKTVLGKWHFDKLVRNGAMYGAAVDATGETIYMQEGRLGYEQYASKSLSLMGLDMREAMHYGSYLRLVDIYEVKVPTDKRDPKLYHAHNYVVSEPYILDGLEYGWDEISREFAYRVYRAQELRYQDTGQLTAVSEDNIDQAPYFVYNTVYTSGKAWNCITEKGEDASQFKSISTKAAFGWHMLYRNSYTKKLVRKVKQLYDPERGWYSGLYEQTGKPNKAITCNTNAIILESLCYKQFGQLLKIGK